MKKLLCLVVIALFMVACSSDTTDTAPPQQPAPASTPAADAVQQATDSLQKAVDQVVEKGEELKDATVQYVEKTSELVATKAQELEADAEQLVQQGSDRLAALVPSARSFDHGSSIYQQSCRSCHDSGLMGAQKIGHARFAADLEVLVENSIKGIGRMPARGGNRNLSDDDVRAAVEYMVEKSK